MEKITYLIANYNNGRYIADCLASLTAQTDPNWQCLIVDDHSSDDSLERIRELLNEKITLLVNDVNLGYIGTLKKLIEHAGTDIVAILDPDDALAPESTEALLKIFQAHPETGFVYSKYATYDAELQTPIEEHGDWIPAHRTSLEDSHIGAIRCFRRSVYRQTSGLDERMRYAEDRDLVYKLEEVTAPVFVDRVLYRYRIVPGSQSNDPLKREIGFRNFFKARQLALQRRNIRGFEKWFYYLFFYEHLWRNSAGTPRWLQRLVLKYGIRLYTLDFLLGIRSGGRLRRALPRIQMPEVPPEPMLERLRGVACYVNVYPEPVRPFLLQEIDRLQQSGLPVWVIANLAGSGGRLDGEIRESAGNLIYAFPLQIRLLLGQLLRLALTSPIKCLRLFAELRRQHHGEDKSLLGDLSCFAQAVNISAFLRRYRCGHLHCPSTDREAVVTRIAAALAGIPFSIRTIPEHIKSPGSSPLPVISNKSVVKHANPAGL